MIYGDDWKQVGPISGENDLLPITIHGSINGSFKLLIPSQNIRIYQNADHTGLLGPKSPNFNGNQNTTVYVEGIKAGKDLTIQLLQYDANNKFVKVAATLPLDVFSWTGPLYVPDYAKYTYVASGIPNTANWVHWEGDGAQDVESGGTGPTREATFFWGEGARMGYAGLQLSGNYEWDLDVNIVHVKVETPDNAFQKIPLAATDAHPGAKRRRKSEAHAFCHAPQRRSRAGSSSTPKLRSSARTGSRATNFITVGFI